jgi:formate hydrogenlyase subunit 3/multisubunit Na+/H+ antiporter MnhD subunit
MNLAGIAFDVALGLAVAAAVAAVASPVALRALVSGAGTALSGLAAMIAGVAALAGQSFALGASGVLPLFGIRLAIDPLGGLFVTLLGAVTAVVAVYGLGRADGVTVPALVPLLGAAMLLVAAADGVGTFLLGWQLMIVTALPLVHRPRTAAGLEFAVLSQAGFVAITVGLLVLGADSFPAVRAARSPLAAVVFLVALLGFAVTIGVAARAAAAAPGRVSALFSVGMAGLGGYGLVRVGLDLLGGGAGWWWAVVLVLGAGAAVAGMARAARATDLQRLLGSAAAANLGVVLVGVGAAGVFAAGGRPVLAGLALAAGLLHVVNHAATLTLLSLGAASVEQATGTRELAALGGLRAGMPLTTVGFGLGALGASALPGGAAFVSVWLLLQSLVHGVPSAGPGSAVLLSVAVAAVALTAGLAIATFVRAFGVGFLGRDRRTTAESPHFPLAAMGLAAVAGVVLALAPTLVLPAVGTVTRTLTGTESTGGATTVELSTVAGSLSPLLTVAALLVGAGVVIGGLRLLAVRPRRTVPVWSGGLPAGTAGTPFAVPLPEISTRVPRLPAVGGAWERVVRALGTGSANRYLGVGLSAVTGLLIVLAVVR